MQRGKRNEDLQDLWNFGRDRAARRNALSDAEVQDKKTGLRREARRFVRDEVRARSDDDLFQLRMEHNACFRAKSHTHTEDVSPALIGGRSRTLGATGAAVA